MTEQEQEWTNDHTVKKMKLRLTALLLAERRTTGANLRHALIEDSRSDFCEYPPGMFNRALWELVREGAVAHTQNGWYWLVAPSNHPHRRPIKAAIQALRDQGVWMPYYLQGE